MRRNIQEGAHLRVPSDKLKEAKVASVKLSFVVLDILAFCWKYGFATAPGPASLSPTGALAGAARAALGPELFCLLRGFPVLCLSASIMVCRIL